jgi:hypothetical protein
MLAISLRPAIPRNPEHLLPGTSHGFEYMKQGKYITGDERGGFEVTKVNLPLPDPKQRLFIQGKEDWLEEGLIMPTRKNKRGRIIEEAILLGTSGGCTTKLCATVRRNSYTAKLLWRATNASMGEWCSHAPTKLCGAQRNLCGALCTISSTTTSVAIIGGYAARNMQNVAAIQSNATQLGEGNANIAYELGRLHLVLSDQFVGGDVQSYYEQGYNHQDYQYQPPAED